MAVGMLADTPFNQLTSQILGAAIEVHRTLGPGLLESTYLRSLRFELHERALRFATERIVPVMYKGVDLGTSHRIDLVVEETVVVEVKSVEHLLRIHQAQVLTYLRLADCPAGLLINFNEARLMDGVKRLFRPRR